MTGASLYPSFKKEWLGKRVDYDHVYNFQCVDEIEEFCHELGVNGVFGNAIDYANKPSPAFAAHFERVTDGSKQPGDVIVLNGLPGNPYGHIALRDTDLDKMLEQNATGSGSGVGRDAIGVYRAIPYNRVAAIYRYKGTAPTPPPAPPKRQTVSLPASVQSWRVYRVGSALRPDTSDQIGVLAPHQFGGLSYLVEGWVGDYAVIITTQYYGRGVIWVKGTPAVIK